MQSAQSTDAVSDFLDLISPVPTMRFFVLATCLALIAFASNTVAIPSHLEVMQAYNESQVGARCRLCVCGDGGVGRRHRSLVVTCLAVATLSVSEQNNLA